MGKEIKLKMDDGRWVPDNGEPEHFLDQFKPKSAQPDPEVSRVYDVNINIVDNITQPIRNITNVIKILKNPINAETETDDENNN